jgi:antitoxin VapB
MPITRAFRCGDSQAIRIPEELAYADTSLDLTITRHGDVITIRPARPSLRRMAETLRSLPAPPSTEPREPIALPDRDLD